MFKKLLEAGADVNRPAVPGGGRTALQAAVENRYNEIVEKLLEVQTDVNAPEALMRGVTALRAAKRVNDAKILQVLLHHEAIAQNRASKFKPNFHKPQIVSSSSSE